MSVFAWVLGPATILGGIAAILVFLPRVTVSASDPPDPANPMSAAFTITNTNFIPLRSVDAALGIGQIMTLPAEPDPNFLPSFESRIDMPGWKGHDLDMDERFTMTPSDLFKLSPGALGGADIAIVVSYKPWILPWRREKVFRFIAKRQTNGQFYWYSLPTVKR
jgi:hypothetical protein